MTGECEFADLFDTCTRPAKIAVQWRHWGRVHYCHEHYREMVDGAKSKDILLVTFLNGILK